MQRYPLPAAGSRLRLHHVFHPAV